MRGNWAKKCLDPGGRRIKDRADSNDEEGGPGMSLAEEIVKWITEVIEVSDVCTCHSNPISFY
jgi:hypothetical protein